uniref:ULP_PROTEASE domain-containing protein n=1 Tax=Caenorhabditis tropicalis TaxID=1561998 RepID=A0A1I7UX19_9PELO
MTHLRQCHLRLIKERRDHGSTSNADFGSQKRSVWIRESQMNISNTVNQWRDHVPTPNEIFAMPRSSSVASFFDQEDVDQTRQHGKMLSSSAVWHLLFKMVCIHNIGRNEEDRIRLVHLEFVRKHGLSKNKKDLVNYEAFARNSRSNQVLVPILQPNAEHWRLLESIQQETSECISSIV